MKTTAKTVNRAVMRAAKAERKLSKAEAKLLQAEAKLEKRKRKFVAAKEHHETCLREAEQLGVHHAQNSAPIE